MSSFEVASGDLYLSKIFSPKTFQNQSLFPNHHNLLKVTSFLGDSLNEKNLIANSIILNLKQMMIRGSVK